MIGIPRQTEIQKALLHLFSKIDSRLSNSQDSADYWEGEWEVASFETKRSFYFNENNNINSLSEMNLYYYRPFTIKKTDDSLIVADKEYDTVSKTNSTNTHIFQVKKERTPGFPIYDIPDGEVFTINYPYPDYPEIINFVFDDIVFLGKHEWQKYHSGIFLPFGGNFLVRKDFKEKYVSMMDVARKFASELNDTLLEQGIYLVSTDHTLKNIPILEWFPFCINIDTQRFSKEEIINYATEKEILSEEIWMSVFEELTENNIMKLGLKIPVVKKLLKIPLTILFKSSLKKKTQNNAYDYNLGNVYQSIKTKKNFSHLLSTALYYKEIDGCVMIFH